MAYENQTQSGANINRTASRIENDIEQIKRFTERVESTTQRIVRHARILGYFEPVSDAKASAPTPVITTMSDAISALDRALDGLSGSLNVFD